MKKLIPLSDFVLEQSKQFESTDLLDYLHVRNDILTKIELYTKFLIQPLKLEMFTSENKLFEGFKLSYNGFSIDSVDKNGYEFCRLSFNKDGQCRQYYNIEEMLNSDDCPVVELTPSALQAIGIKE
jgi:hypothetical protein